VTQKVTGKLFVGIDVGASAVKVVVLDGKQKIIGEGVARTGVDLDGAAKGCLAEVLASHSLTKADLAEVTATGFGRHNVSFATATKTEIGCHAKGCFHYFPKAITILDIGGQDNKIIRLDDKGNTVDFKMNRKCSAGTGSFLEEIAARLDVDLSDLDGIATSTEETVELGSYCTVFSKTEVLARMREGKPLAAILRGALLSVVQRVAEIGTLDGDIVMSGGVVAHNRLVARLMEERVGKKVLLPPSPQTIGALGAALFAVAASPNRETGEVK